MKTEPEPELIYWPAQTEIFAKSYREFLLHRKFFLAPI